MVHKTQKLSCCDSFYLPWTSSGCLSPPGCWWLSRSLLPYHAPELHFQSLFLFHLLLDVLHGSFFFRLSERQKEGSQGDSLHLALTYYRNETWMLFWGKGLVFSMFYSTKHKEMRYDCVFCMLRQNKCYCTSARLLPKKVIVSLDQDLPQLSQIFKVKEIE